MLIDLKSNLKNLKVDKDRPFGGSSGLPYIKGGLPEDSPAGEYIADLARYSSDGAVRGGLFSIAASTTDTIRISRFLNDFPKGLLFTSKQIGLQKSNPKIETGTRGEVLNTQVYSNSNLLAQIALQGTGEHVPRPGFNVNNLLKEENKYEKIVKNKPTNENRLVTLYNNKINKAPSDNLPDNLKKLGISLLNNELFDYEGGPGSSYGLGNTLIPRVVNTTTSYDNYILNTSFRQSVPQGGIYALSKFWNKINNLSGSLKPEDNPPSTFYSSLGNIVNQIEFNNAIPTEPDGITLYQEQVGTIRNESDSISDLEGNSTFLGNTQKYSQLLKNSINGLPPILQDFRKYTDAKSLSSDYSNREVNIATRISIGNPGSRTRDQRKYINQTNNGDGQDKINLIPLYTWEGDPIQDNKVRDLIKFAIEVIDNDNPEKTVPLHFRAFITDFSDNIGATWNGQKYMGRGEDFYTYQGFTREVSFKLTVAAQSKQEMMPLYQKLNYLASSLHPDYSDGGFMRGNLHKLTVGEWFYRTPGILKSMNISVDNNYPWEIKYNEPETSKFGTNDFAKNVNVNNYKNGTVDGGTENFQNSNSDADMMELPQILSVQFSFTPILNNLPKLAKQGGRFTSTPILISDHGRQENFIKRITN
jgi:hypothetical protein